MGNTFAVKHLPEWYQFRVFPAKHWLKTPFHHIISCFRFDLWFMAVKLSSFEFEPKRRKKNKKKLQSCFCHRCNSTVCHRDCPWWNPIHSMMYCQCISVKRSAFLPWPTYYYSWWNLLANFHQLKRRRFDCVQVEYIARRTHARTPFYIQFLGW